MGNLLAGTRPTNLGVQDGKFTAPSPSYLLNCICSQSENPPVAVEPLQLPEPLKQEGEEQTVSIMDRLQQVIEGIGENATIVEKTENYLYVQFRTWIGFVDDTEFYFDGTVIQVRSASRLGKKDFGKNLQRIKAIRAALLE